MATNNELKKVGITSWTCHYFDDLIKIKEFEYIFYWLKNQTKIIRLMTFYTKPLLVQKQRVLGLINR